MPATHDVGQQVVLHANPGALVAAYAMMKATIDAKGVVQCGVLSGARGPFPRPEHYLLAFAYDVIDGKEAFLFWDPDANRSNIAGTPRRRERRDGGRGSACSSRQRPGSRPRRTTPTSRRSTGTTSRNSSATTRSRRGGHCYQVFSLQSLPLPKRVKVQALVQIGRRSKCIPIWRGDFRLRSRRSKPQAQFDLAHPAGPVGTVLCECDASARYRRS